MKTKVNNFHQNMASVGKKLQKSINLNTKLDKEITVELIKAMFKKNF